jgi:hypothetical protein
MDQGGLEGLNRHTLSIQLEVCGLIDSGCCDEEISDDSNP